MLVFPTGRDQIIDNEATRELVTRNYRRLMTIVDYANQTHSIQFEASVRNTREIVRWLDSLHPGMP